jgi:hypothetical protein
MNLFKRWFGPPNIEKLERRGDVDALIAALKHEDAEIQRQAVNALGHLGDKRALEPLFDRAVRASDKGIRRSTAKALRKIAGPEIDVELRRRTKEYRARFYRKQCPRCGEWVRASGGYSYKEMEPWWDAPAEVQVPPGYYCKCGNSYEGIGLGGRWYYER